MVHITVVLYSVKLHGQILENQEHEKLGLSVTKFSPNYTSRGHTLTVVFLIL